MAGPARREISDRGGAAVATLLPAWRPRDGVSAWSYGLARLRGTLRVAMSGRRSIWSNARAQRTKSGRVQDGDSAPPHLLENDKVVQVPVQDAGHLQLGQFIQLQAQGATAEVERSGVGDELLERRALQGDRETTPQVRQVNVQSMRV